MRWSDFSAGTLKIRRTIQRDVFAHAYYQSPYIVLNQESEDVETMMTCPVIEGVQRHIDLLADPLLDRYSGTLGRQTRCEVTVA